MGELQNVIYGLGLEVLSHTYWLDSRRVLHVSHFLTPKTKHSLQMLNKVCTQLCTFLFLLLYTNWLSQPFVLFYSRTECVSGKTNGESNLEPIYMDPHPCMFCSNKALLRVAGLMISTTKHWSHLSNRIWKCLAKKYSFAFKRYD